ncbi:MAG TPA: CHASE3 domain-containing protein [Bryobacteraceae bacterium]|nr:CHASE3 domain-containing protein [Bryobacteraceae bacterium]
MTSDRSRGRVTRTPEALMLGISLLIIGLIAFLSYRSGEAAHTARQEGRITEDILTLDAALLSTLKDAETGQRGFLLTGEERYLDPYNAAIAAMPALLDRMRATSALRPDQAARFTSIEPLLTQKLSELKSTIDFRRAKRLPDAMAIVETDRGKQYMDEVRAICAEIERVEVKRRDDFDAAAAASAANLRRVSVGGSLILAVFLVLSTIAIFRGIARRDELFRRAFAGETLLATTLAGIADGVIATDADGRITFINPVAQKLTGWGEAEANGSPINRVFQIVNETTRLKVDNPIDKALAQGVVVGLANHTNLISKTGGEVPIDDSAAPLWDAQDNLIGAVIVFRDISARRNAEDALRISNQELQQFVDAAAHDLRAPLGTVKVMAQLLAKQFAQDLGPSGLELTGHINRGLERSLNLLEDLLAFARATHFDESAAKPTSLDAAFQSAVENLKTEIEASGAIVTCELLPTVTMDRAHALQLFQNLLGNALKYHGDTPPRIHVAVRKDNAEWLLSFADNGIGIAHAYIEEIFKPFKRLHGDSHPGSGIGLSTCQKIVKGYGGRIWAESVPGAGSTFFVALPAVEEEVGKPTAAAG